MEKTNNKIKLLAVVGPTASGKTSLAVELARRHGGEIISCDSMQIYKYLSVATAKPTAQEMQGVRHHLVDFLEPSVTFSVAEYVALADKAVQEIIERGNLPVLCGGTGLYYSSFAEGLHFSKVGSDEALRQELEARAAAEGNAALLEELRAVDPETAQKLHPNNLKRIIRAIEHYRLSGIPISEQNRLSRQTPPRYEVLALGIGFHDRQKLYERIDARVDAMLENGLLEEAKWYFSQSGFKTASAAIGYKELQPYFSGECTLAQAIENLKKETRHYAKRQLTWFKRDETIRWIYADDAQGISLAEQAQAWLQQEAFFAQNPH